MAVTPLNGHNSNSRTYWLDKALEGQSPEIKARVLELILKMGIEPEDEFFVIFVAIGQLQVLLLEAPERWKEIFSGFIEQLEQLAQTSEKKLANPPARGSTGDEELKKSIIELTEICSGLETGLEDTGRGVSKSIKVLQTEVNELKSSHYTALKLLRGQNEQLAALKTLTDALKGAVRELALSVEEIDSESGVSSSVPPPASLREWVRSMGESVWIHKEVFLLQLFIFLLGFGTASLMPLGHKQLLESTAQRTQWLLEKENRRDCLQGIKPQGSPECQEVFKKVKVKGKGK